MNAKNHKIVSGFILIGLSSIAGMMLRLYQISGQILVGDEWQGVKIALNHSFAYIISHFHEYDNCILLSLFYRLLLNMSGLNEVGVHLLQIIAGISMLVIFPFLIQKVVNRWTAVIFSMLLATSPLLVYYSRYGRPYIIVVFLTFIAILSFYAWFKKGNNLYAAAYIGFGVLATYLNLFAIASIIAPITCFICLACLQRIKPDWVISGRLPDIKQIFLIAAILTATLFLLLLPALGSMSEITQKIGDSNLNVGSVKGFLNLLNGTKNSILTIIFSLLFIHGIWRLYQIDVVFGSLVTTIPIFYAIIMLVVQPFGISEPLVLARYVISYLPFYLLTIAVSLAELGQWIENLMHKSGMYTYKMAHPFIFLFFLACICIVSPIPRIYGNVNNFTNHFDFQGDYHLGSINLTPELVLRMPGFYTSLKDEANDVVIIETPYSNYELAQCYHLYQRYHQKKVMIGYSKPSIVGWPDNINIANNKFIPTNLIRLSGSGLIAGKRYAYVIVHKDLIGELLYIRNGYSAYEKLLSHLKQYESYYEKRFGQPLKNRANRIKEICEAKFGKPFFEDHYIAVFKTS
ncbi:MAG: glycosyltransferase family 39 protein [Bacteroidales bacterium]|nr:glycosyltransferase family 39 protein [Bacteroidales bacterium]